MRGPHSLSRRVYARSYGAYVFRRHIPTWRTGRVQSAGAVTSAQPSGSSWRPSRVAARLYCSNKSYHPAITAPITPPRDEYILVLTLPLVSPFPHLSLSLIRPRVSRRVCCCSSILQHLHDASYPRHHPRVTSRSLIFLLSASFCIFYFFSPFWQRARYSLAFFLLSLRAHVFSVLVRHASRLILPFSGNS